MHELKQWLRLLEAEPPASLRLTTRSGQPFVVLRNPTRAAFEALSAKYETLRGLLSGDGQTIYLWDAYKAEHNTVSAELGIETDEYWDCIWWYRLLKKWHGSVYRADTEAGDLIYKPAIRRLMPPPPPPRAEPTKLTPEFWQDFDEFDAEHGVREGWDHYTEIGHKKGNVVWYMMPDGKLITHEYKTKRDNHDMSPDGHESRAIAVGRIDNTQNKISVRTALAPGNAYYMIPEVKLDFIRRHLERDYPDYEIWYFGNAATDIRRIDRNRVMENHLRRWMNVCEGWGNDDGPSEEHRTNIVNCTEDEWRLPNLHEIVPPDQLHPMVKLGLKNITIYRAVPEGVTDIRPGDWVALSKSYAARHVREGSGHVLTKRVPAIDVAWAGTDMNEYYYAPRNSSHE
jgi:hypothetical protein